MHIPENVLRSVLEAADIRQVIEEFVPLKKRGRNWIGLCPFHPDKDPSFSISPEKQIFYCFGCGEGGDVLKFLMKLQGMTFVEAVKNLAGRYGIHIPEETRSPIQQRRRKMREVLISLNDQSADFFHRNLLESPDGSRARAYLRERGLDENIISKFRLGWAQDKWEGLVNHLRKNGLSLEDAEKAGLVIARKPGSGCYDRFRNRIIFPIMDRSGSVVALGGRVLGDDQPKYLNSPETLVYHKGKVLYGLFQNRGAIRSAGVGYLVEGYMDLLALVQAGITNVVATLGTALTENHARQLKGLCRDWVLSFDGDSAGIKAAIRAVPLFYNLNMGVNVMSLSDGDDPDSYIRREGPESWKLSGRSSPTGMDFVIEQGLAAHGRGPEGKFRILEDVLGVLSMIDDPLRKSLLLGHAAQKIGVREESLWEGLGGGGSKDRRNRNTVRRHGREKTQRHSSDPKPGENRAEAKLIGFILCHPEYLGTFEQVGLDMWLEDPSIRELWRAIFHLFNLEGRFELSELCRQLVSMPDLKAMAMRLAADFPPCDNPDEMHASLIRYCEERRKRTLRRHLMEQIRSSEDDVDHVSLLRQLQQLR